MNPSRADADWPAAVIAGAWRTGVLGMRSLRRRGVRVCAFDCTSRDVRSAYGHAYACPNPDADPERWVEFLIDLARRVGGRPVLIASSDQFVSAIARHAGALDPHYRLSPGARLQGLLATKQTQYQLAAEHGMPMPRTEFVSGRDQVDAFAAKAQFPCLLKPIHFR